MIQVESKGQQVLLGYGPANHQDYSFLTSLFLMLRFDRGAGNFYIMPVPNKRVARVNLACDEKLKAEGGPDLKSLDFFTNIYIYIVLHIDQNESSMPLKDSIAIIAISLLMCFFPGGIRNTQSVMAADQKF